VQKANPAARLYKRLGYVIVRENNNDYLMVKPLTENEESVVTHINYLAVDSNDALAEFEAAGWAKRGIGMERVDDMTDAIKMLTREEYLYIGINGDAVDYLPLLRTMRSLTDIPILIATNNFTTKKEVDALRNGANLYARFHENNEGNIDSVIVHIMSLTEGKKPPRKVLIYNDLLIVPAFYQVFVKNTEVMLTKKEFDILHYFVENQGILLTFPQILSHVWGADSASPEALWTHIKNIRKKLSDISPFYENIIENIHGFGYKLTY
jgi:DNA-binding response OmpR family regulator